MRTPQSIRNLILSSALVLSSLPGCQGEEPLSGAPPEALGASGGVWARGVVVNASGVFVAGSGQGDVGNPSGIGPSNAHNYVAKFDLAGTRQWVTQQSPAKLPSGADTPVMCQGLAMDPSGNFYLGGYTGGSFDGNTLVGSDDGFVTKLPAR
ncbi:MAG TPA: hypothetical protein VE153_34545 [Myxococcus sp.]|nr:hypothetical protein [Myxococcus sp.]